MPVRIVGICILASANAIEEIALAAVPVAGPTRFIVASRSAGGVACWPTTTEAMRATSRAVAYIVNRRMEPLLKGYESTYVARFEGIDQLIRSRSVRASMLPPLITHTTFFPASPDRLRCAAASDAAPAPSARL